MISLSAHADILVDADEVNSLREIIAVSILEDTMRNGLSVSQIHIVSKSQVILEKYVSTFQKSFIHAQVSCAVASKRKYSTDIQAAIWFGKLSTQLNTNKEPYQLYLISKRKLVLDAALSVLGNRHTIVIPEDGFSSKSGERIRFHTIHNLKDRVVKERTKEVALPIWATDTPDSQNCIGLHWIADNLNTKIVPFPSFIPFPSGLSKVRLGGKGKNVEIDLSIWETRRGLYSPHVIFQYLSYPESCWILNSTHGFRRKNKKVQVSGKRISAAQGNIKISTGTIIVIGDFKFSFQDNIIINNAFIEDQKALIASLEKGFCILTENIPYKYIPENICKELSCEGSFSLQNAYLRHYAQIFSAVWNKSIIEWLDAAFCCKTDMKKCFGSLIRFRNILFHPSRPPLTDIDKIKLSRLYVHFTKETPGWPC